MGPLKIMAAEAAALVILEVLAILFFLQQAYKHPDARESAERMLRNRLFVVGYFVLGLAVPLVVMLALYTGRTGESMLCILGATWVGAALGLIGGLILRWAVLVCGALPTWNIAGFQFRRIARPKQAKPEVGLLPPQ